MTIEELLEANNIEFVDYGGHHHTRPGWIQLETCPFCGSDKYHLGINLASLYASCWKCGGHRLSSLLYELRVPKAEAQQFLSDPERQAFAAPKKERGNFKELKWRGPLLKSHREYLAGRGFDPEKLAELWQIEGIGVAPLPYAWRIYIPITKDLTRISWTTRAIGADVEQRYLSASAGEEAINHKDVVYGLDYCSHSVVVCEGPFDAWAVGPGGGATLGITYSTCQVRQLARVPFRFVCFDSAPDAQRRAKALCAELACFPGHTENIVLDAKDPAAASKKEIKLLRKAARL